MWAGWANDGADLEWDPAADRDPPLRRLAARAAAGYTLARHHDDALEIYLYDYHGDVPGTQEDLLMLAGAGRFADAGAPVMYWGGDVYPDLPLGGDRPLAILLVDRDGARFVDSYPVAALIERLRPVEAAFLAAVDDEGDGAWDSTHVLDAAIREQVPAADGP